MHGIQALVELKFKNVVIESIGSLLLRSLAKEKILNDT